MARHRRRGRGSALGASVAGVFASGMAAQLFTACAALLVARSSGPSAFGFLSTCLALVVILSDLLDLGTSTVLVRESAAKTLPADYAHALIVARSRYFGSLISLAWLAFATLLFRQYHMAMLGLALYLFAFPLNFGLASICRSVGRYGLTATLGASEKFGVLAVTGTVYITQRNWTLFAFALALGLFSAASSVFYSFASKQFPSSAAPSRSLSDLVVVYRRSFRLGISNLATDLNILEIPAVAVASSAAIAGQFAVAARFINVLGIPATAITSVMLPELSRTGSKHRLKQLIRACAVPAVALAAGLGISFSFAPWLVSHFLGSSFGNGTATAVRITCIVVVLASVNQVLYTVLVARHRESVTALWVTACVLGGIVLAALGASLWGAPGAACGGVVAQAVLLVALAIGYRSSHLTTPASTT